MAVHVYNTMTGQIEPLTPMRGNRLGMYICGPTVYDYSHIGHARTYIAFDVILRYLRYRGYDVKCVINITNVDDKIINRARETGDDPLALADQFERVFHEDMEALNVLRVGAYPRVTDHIPEIIRIVQTLIEKGYAYRVDGDVYFDTTRVEDYGRLSHQSIEDIRAGARVEVDERKRNPADFALWKSAKEGEPSWESPWGRGRPGWHIECTAMSVKYLGEQFDIHGGARDLIFPHHENEIVQSEAYTGKRPFVRFWLHTGFLTINGEKMSKSLGNIIAIQDLLKRHEADAFRLFILSTHYRSPIDFTEETLEGSERSLRRINDMVDELRKRIEETEGIPEARGDEGILDKEVDDAKRRFIKAMDEDFNTPKALASFYDLIRIGNKALSQNAGHLTLTRILEAITELSQVLGILGKERKRRPLPKEVEELIAERDRARKEKDWKRADEIRNRLRDVGIILEDYPEGTRWRLER